MPQYRVKLTITRTEIIDLVADDAAEARYGATVMMGGTYEGELIIHDVTLISGQPVEEYQAVNEPLLQGEEDGA